MIHIPISERLPQAGKIVLFFYTNVKGHYRCLRGFYSDGTLKTEDYFDDDYNDWWEDCYVEEKDEYLLPQGWWEYGEVTEKGCKVSDQNTFTHWCEIVHPDKAEHPMGILWKIIPRILNYTPDERQKDEIIRTLREWSVEPNITENIPKLRDRETFPIPIPDAQLGVNPDPNEE